jgi:BlaI family transcriptional regulator, penicillinase repressor
MTRRGRDVTDAELAVLRLLWREDELSVRAIADELYPGGGASDYATVKKLLARLEKKGIVGRRKGEGAILHRALVARDELIGRRLRETADSLCEGSLTPLLTHLVQADALSDQDRAMLRALIDGEVPDEEDAP